MKSLDDLDPLPKLQSCFEGPPPSKRSQQEWKKACQVADGEDWIPVRQKPHLFVNGKGQMGYRPPEPPVPTWQMDLGWFEVSVRLGGCSVYEAWEPVGSVAKTTPEALAPAAAWFLRGHL